MFNNKTLMEAVYARRMLDYDWTAQMFKNAIRNGRIFPGETLYSTYRNTSAMSDRHKGMIEAIEWMADELDIDLSDI